MIFVAAEVVPVMLSRERATNQGHLWKLKTAKIPKHQQDERQNEGIRAKTDYIDDMLVIYINPFIILILKGKFELIRPLGLHQPSRGNKIQENLTRKITKAKQPWRKENCWDQTYTAGGEISHAREEIRDLERNESKSIGYVLLKSFKIRRLETKDK